MAYYNLKLKHYFIHIPKNGGKAVAKFLMNLPEEFAFTPLAHGHMSSAEIETNLSEQFPDTKWTGVAVVRNPYTRYVSAYDFGLYTSKIMIEGRHRKANKVVANVEKSWVEFGKLTPQTLLEEWIKYERDESSINFREDLPYLTPTLRTQSSYVIPTTVKFNMESLKHLKRYFEELIHLPLNDIHVMNATPLPYAKLQGLNVDTQELVRLYYADDFVLGKYPKEIINSQILNDDI